MSGELEVREALMRWLETRPEAVVDQAFLNLDPPMSWVG